MPYDSHLIAFDTCKKNALMQLEKGEVHDIEHIPNQELATVFNDVVSVGNNLATLATIQLKAPWMWRQLLIKPKMQQIVVEIWSKSYDAVHWAKYFALSKEVREFYNSCKMDQVLNWYSNLTPPRFNMGRVENFCLFTTKKGMG